MAYPPGEKSSYLTVGFLEVDLFYLLPCLLTIIIENRNIHVAHATHTCIIVYVSDFE